MGVGVEGVGVVEGDKSCGCNGLVADGIAMGVEVEEEVDGIGLLSKRGDPCQ